MEKTQNAGSKCAADIAALLRARNPFLLCVSRDEARSERIIVEACAAASYAPVVWDCSTGLTPYGSASGDSSITDPAQVFNMVRSSSVRRAWLMRDLSPWLKDPTVNRGLASLCRTLPSNPRDNAQAIILLSASADVPVELSGHAIVIDIPMPDRSEIATLLDACIEALPDDIKATAAPNGKRDAAIDAAIGLSAQEAQATFARSVILKRSFDPASIAGEKKRIISKERTLEWYDPLPAGLYGVGGYELLKSWLIQRASAFSPAARDYGLIAPRGLLLVGVPGTGKSLTAKAVATAWNVPLLRMDVAGLKSKWVGDSEANIRRALKIADTIGRCVLWLDEIEKALSGATSASADGGTSTDQLGALLTWMQEHTSEVFVVATANDVRALPPELMRRFDAIFFTDLPTTSERASIIKATLAGSKVPGCASIDADAIARSTRDFTGAELAALVPAAAFAAFADGARPIADADLLNAASETVPLAKTAADKIASLRAWAVGRAKPASMPELAAVKSAVSLDV